MATSKKSSAKETVKSESASEELDHGLNVAPSMPYYCTWLPGACPTDTKTANAQTLPFTMPPMCPPPGAGAATIVPTFVPPCPTMPVICVPTVNPPCPKPGAQANVAEGAQTATIITCTGIPIVCGAGAQPQTIIQPTQTMCQAPAAAQTILPPTLPPACPPPVTGIPFVCNQGAQAQTVFGPTAYLGCNAATTTVQTTAAQAQTVMVPPTSHAPPYCPAGAQAQTVFGPTAYLGCNTATTTVQTITAQAQTVMVPPTSHAPPYCPAGAQAQTIVGPTAYLGCNTATTTVQTQAQTIVGPTAYPGCNTATTTVQRTFLNCPPPAAQAQGITGMICSIIPTACAVTIIAGCNAAGAQAVGDTFANPVCNHGGRTVGATCDTIATTCTQITCGGAAAQTIINPTTHPTANTMCYICPPPTIGTLQGGAQAQTVYPVTTLCMPQSIGCPPNAPTMTATTTVQAAVGSPAQAQGTIGTISIIPVACLATAIGGCFTKATCAQAQTVIQPTTTVTTPQGAQAQAVTVLTAPPICGGINTNICPTAAPNCTGIHTNACTVGAQAQAAMSPTTTVAHQTLATVCTQTGPVNTIVTLNGCPRPTIQTQIGCVTQPPICFYTTITQPIGQCPPAGTGPQPQTIVPSVLAFCPQTHPLATCPPQGVAQAQGISGVFCGVTNTIVNTITITVNV